MPGGLQLSITQSKQAFFDRAAVTRNIDKTTARAFVKIGSLGRRIERNMIRYSPNPSKSGKPPHAHGSNSLLKEKIFFVYDATNKSVVIGPALINGAKSIPPGKTVPEVLEFGGTIVFPRSTWVTESATSGRLRRRIVESVTRQMQPRPFAAPTMEILETKYQKLWAGDWQGGRA
jgi:hypothetical protein